jgi:hypothetical protein
MLRFTKALGMESEPPGGDFRRPPDSRESSAAPRRSDIRATGIIGATDNQAYLTSGHSPSFNGRNAWSAGIVARVL